MEKPAIKAVLTEASVTKLKELAKNYYVKGYSKMNKPTLVQAVSVAFRQKEDRPKRSLSLRQREEIQEVLWAVTAPCPPSPF